MKNKIKISKNQLKRFALVVLSVFALVSFGSPSQEQEIRSEGYFFMNGELQRMPISIIIYQSRDYGTVRKIGNYIFNGNVNGIPPRGYLGADIKPLNQNNQMAVKYNFTHFAESSTFRTIYLRL